MVKRRYQGALTHETEPFDPLELTERTKKIVCEGDSRKYTDFYTVGVYGGIATGYTVGCNLRCFFCWVGPGRDRPMSHGDFYSTEETAKKLMSTALKEGVDKVRISGGEPTLCREHLLEVLDRLEGDDALDTFILETNGILFGNDESYVDEIEQYELIYVRVSLKAGFPEEWERKTGAKAETLKLPYKAIEHLWKRDVDFHVAAMVDSRITSEEEMWSIYKKVSEVSEGLAENIEWETIDKYPNTKRRLKKAGVKLEDL
ncbi:MAG: radical SAM protein [Candidatus Thermoplasmatota archaeon]